MAKIAIALGLDASGKTSNDLADAAITEISRLFAAIGITPTLAALGLAEDKLDWTAEQAVGIERLIKNNPRPIDLASMKRLIRASFSGDLSAAAF
jgi:alcohol dehydrogenase class IV